jgi:hypothetical protein
MQSQLHNTSCTTTQMVTNGKEGTINGAVKITTVGACHHLNGQCCGLESNFPHIAEAVIATKLKLGVDQRVLQRNFPAHIHLSTVNSQPPPWANFIHMVNATRGA